MQQTCAQPWCKQPFENSPEDLALLEKLSPVIGGKKFPLPPPTLCFRCRLQRRLAFYNARSLYRRTCDKTQKPIVAIYSPTSKQTVYDRDVWYGDDWDPFDYGQEFDPSRPFFPQFRALMDKVPVAARAVLGQNENSDYTNDNWKLKNCYLVFDGEQGQDMYYGQTFEICRDSMDFLVILQCELCYECINCVGCYNLRYARFCVNCHDSWFLRDCIGCRDCFGCANLRQKQYCMFNEQKTKEEYENFLRSFRSSSWNAVREMRARADAFFLTQPVKAMRGEQNIDSVGDNLHSSKNSFMCFDSGSMHDSRYMSNCLRGAKDSSDIHIWGSGMELCYNGVVIGSSPQRVVCGYYVTESASDVLYSLFCSRSSSHLLGCIGLRHQQYCIFNKQYSKEEYERLAARIIQQMMDAGEWGKFFPPEMSMFGYNETMAQTYFPLEKTEVTTRGWKWSDYEAPVEAKKSVPAEKLPDETTAIPDDILNWALVCEVSKKPFKLTKQELDIYRSRNLPIPRRHPDQRHRDRFTYKNPFQLFQRTCTKCKKTIQTTYAPNRPEIVYCEECYLATVY